MLFFFSLFMAQSTSPTALSPFLFRPPPNATPKMQLRNGMIDSKNTFVPSTRNRQICRLVDKYFLFVDNQNLLVVTSLPLDSTSSVPTPLPPPPPPSPPPPSPPPLPKSSFCSHEMMVI